jgi:DNA polymerase I
MNKITVATRDELRLLQERLVNVPKYTFDTETTGLRWWKDRIFLMSFCDGRDAWLVPVKNFPDDVLREFFRAVFSDGQKTIIGQNIKFDLNMVKSNFGVDCRRQTHDTKIMLHLYDETKQNSLKPACERLLGIAPEESNAVDEWLKDHIPEGTALRVPQEERKGKWFLSADYNYSHVPDEIMHPYAIQDAILTWELYHFLWPTIEQHFLPLFTTETELLPITMEMEQAGVPVDVPYLKELKDKFWPQLWESRVTFLHQARRIHPIGEDFNLDSHEQLADFLYGKLGLRAPFNTKGGKPSVSMDALEMLEHPLVPYLLKYAYANSRLKFVQNLLDFVDSKGLIHANFNTTGTVSGRFSCTEPNLQNIVKDPVILKAFIASPGEAMFHWDYSLLEMIPMAMYSQDHLMLQALRAGQDLHRFTASQVFGVPYDKVTSDQRQVGKGTNFSMIFGVGKDKYTGYVNGYLPEGAKISKTQGLEFREKYHKRFTGPRAFMRKVSATVSANRDPWSHFVRGYFGRVRRLDPMKGYQGANFLCQNWGGDLMKASMVKLKKSVLKDIPLRQQIHDDIRVDIRIENPIHRDEFVREVSRVMCDWPQFDVPLRTECKFSDTNWAEMKTYEFQKEAVNAA